MRILNIKRKRCRQICLYTAWKAPSVIKFRMLKAFNDACRCSPVNVRLIRPASGALIQHCVPPNDIYIYVVPHR